MKYKKELTVLDNIQVRASDLHGYGVFALEDIPKGKIIEHCYAITLKNSIRNYPALHNYLFEDSTKKGKCVILLGYGMIYNHAMDLVNQNVKYWHLPEVSLFLFQAIKDIKKGDELLVNYGKGNTATSKIQKHTAKSRGMKQPSDFLTTIPKIGTKEKP